MSNELAEYNKDKTALANYESAEQVKEIGDRYKGLHKALKGWKGRTDEYYKAFEMMIEAYRIIGIELLKIENPHGGNRRSEDFQVSDGNLKELGISKKQAFEWRGLAKIPPTIIEDYINTRRAETDTPTMAALQDIARKYKTADEVCREGITQLQPTMNTFRIYAGRLIEHLKEFPDSRKAVPKEFFKDLELFKEQTDKLERRII